MSSRSGWSAGTILILAGPAFADPAAPAAAAASASPPAAAIAGLLDPPPPRGARAGQCFVKVLAPKVVRSATTRVLVSPARRTLTTRPGVCRTEGRLEVVRPPSTLTTLVPAVTKRVLETRIVRPAEVREEVIAAVYQDVSREIAVEPAHLEWRSQGAVDTGAPPYAGGPVRGVAGGERLCLIQIPAVFQTVTQRVMTEPEQIRRVEIPAETMQVSREVVVRPALQKMSTDPGETRRVPVTICQPDETVLTEEPAVYQSEREDRVVSPAHYVWRPTACLRARRRCRCGAAPAPASAGSPVSASEPAVREPAPPAFHPVGDGAVVHLQQELAARGYYHGPADGLFTTQTMTAMTRFQHDHHLAEGRYTQETASALNRGG